MSVISYLREIGLPVLYFHEDQATTQLILSHRTLLNRTRALDKKIQSVGRIRRFAFRLMGLDLSKI